MTDIFIKGAISISTDQKDLFIKEFRKFLESQKASFRGDLQSYDFTDVEIIEDAEVTN